MKKTIASLFAVVMVTAVINVAVVAAFPPTAAPHSKIVTGVKTTTPTMLTFTCPTQVKLNAQYDIGGSLTAGGKGVSGALINEQQLRPGETQWTTWSTTTTDNNGNINDRWYNTVAGLHTYRLSYDGDSQYGPSVSNEVAVTAS